MKSGDRVLSLGRHASHVTVSAAPQSLAKLPDSVSFDEGTFGVLGSVSMHGVRKARIELGEFAAITGMGLVGQLALQLAAQTGAELLFAIDLSDSRLEVAKASRATHVLNPNRCDLRSEVDRITEGRGLDVIIEASGYPELLPVAFDMARIGGRIMGVRVNLAPKSRGGFYGLPPEGTDAGWVSPAEMSNSCDTCLSLGRSNITGVRF